ncbi:hypothetical protein D9M68_311950 [compost metagenome]
MAAVAVVALAVVLEHQLPVAPLHQIGLEGHLAVFQVVRSDEGGNGIAEPREVRCLVRHADVDVAVHHLAMGRLETVVGRIEIRPHVAGEQQFSVQVERPLVIGADQSGDLALGLGAHLGAAMPAGIVECTDLAIPAAHHGDRVVADLQGQVLAGLLQLEGMAGEDPLPVPDSFEVLAIYLGVAVGGARQCVALLALANQVQYGGSVVHCHAHSRSGTGGCVGFGPLRQTTDTDSTARISRCQACAKRLQSHCAAIARSLGSGCRPAESTFYPGS